MEQEAGHSVYVSTHNKNIVYLLYPFINYRVYDTRSVPAEKQKTDDPARLTTPLLNYTVQQHRLTVKATVGAAV